MRWTVIEKGDNCVLKLGKSVASYFSERQKNVEKALARARLGGPDSRGERRKSALRDLRYLRVHLHSPTVLFFCRIKRPLVGLFNFSAAVYLPNFLSNARKIFFLFNFQCKNVFSPSLWRVWFSGFFSPPHPCGSKLVLHIFTCRDWRENFGIILKWYEWY